MNILKLKANERNKLKFEVNVQGATEPITEIRFTIKDDNLIHSYPCALKNNIVEVEISDLSRDDMFNKFMLEVFIGNKYFSPVEGELEILKPVIVESKIQTIEEDEPRVKAQPTIIQSEETFSVNKIVNEIDETPIVHKSKITEDKKREIKSDIKHIFEEKTNKKKEESKEEDEPIIVGKIKNLFK